MRTLVKVFIGLIVVAAMVGGGYAYQLSKILKVEMTSLRRGDLQTYVEDSARVRLDRWQVVSAPLAGDLGPVLVDVGDEVKAGQVLARLDDTRYREGLAQAQSSIRELEARIEGLSLTLPRRAEKEQAALQVLRADKAVAVEKSRLRTLTVRLEQVERDLSRNEALLSGGVSPAAEAERLTTERSVLKESIANQRNLQAIAELNHKVAQQMVKLLTERMGDTVPQKKAFRAGIERIRSEMSLLKRDRGKSEILAPFAGVVLERYTRGNEFCRPGAPLVRIGDPATIQVEMDLLSEDLPEISLGRAAVVSGRSIGKQELRGRVKQIYPEAFTKISSLGIEQQRVRLIIEVKDPQTLLKPGIAVDVKIESTKAENVLLAPEKSVFTLKEKSYVFTVEAGKLSLAEVETGLSDDEFVEIRKGLGESQKIVANPDNDMNDEMAVKIAGEKAGAKEE